MEEFETGAKTHAVNDLILFTDNTKELTLLRDKIYREWVEKGNPYSHEWTLTDQFQGLLEKAIHCYMKEFPNYQDHKHVLIYARRGKESESSDFCKLYADDFDNWKKENGYDK